MKILIALVLAFNTLAIEGVYEVIIRKHLEKTQTRWTLGDWLATKRKIALMDQWLALNTEKNLFEFVLDYRQFEYKKQSDQSKVKDSYYKAKLYFTLLGLEYNWNETKSDMETKNHNVSLRFFGTSQQSTHFNFLYGKKEITHKTYGKFKPGFLGYEGDIYLLSFLGATGTYEKIDEAKNSNYSLSGEVNEYGAFIELLSLRIYATKRKEKYHIKTSTTKSFIEKEGDVVGISLIL